MVAVHNLVVPRDTVLWYLMGPRSQARGGKAYAMAAEQAHASPVDRWRVAIGNGCPPISCYYCYYYCPTESFEKREKLAWPTLTYIVEQWAKA